MVTYASTTCGAVMDPKPLLLTRRDTVRSALALLLEHRLLALPIVGDNDRYLGMFLKSRLIATLLPAGTTLGETVHHITQMPDIAFMQLSVDGLRTSFAAIADKPAASLIDVNTPVFRPDSPLGSALLQLYRTRNFVPVVEAGSERLVGMISTWSVLSRLVTTPALQPAV